jgi:hypothetical protein
LIQFEIKRSCDPAVLQLFPIHIGAIHIAGKDFDNDFGITWDLTVNRFKEKVTEERNHPTRGKPVAE